MNRDSRFHASEDFVCRHCKRPVEATSYGTRHRNHCPHCLWSLHLDESPGDRRSVCKALMEPIGIWVKRDGEWSIIHRCSACGQIRANRISGDDSAWAMMSLAAKPLAQPPFPMEI